MQTCSSELWKIASRGGRWVKMNHLRTVQTRNVVVSNVMMSNAPKMTCPGDPRAQTHKQIQCFHARGNTRNVCEKMIRIIDIAEVCVRGKTSKCLHTAK